MVAGNRGIGSFVALDRPAAVSDRIHLRWGERVSLRTLDRTPTHLVTPIWQTRPLDIDRSAVGGVLAGSLRSTVVDMQARSRMHVEVLRECGVTWELFGLLIVRNGIH